MNEQNDYKHVISYPTKAYDDNDNDNVSDDYDDYNHQQIELKKLISFHIFIQQEQHKKQAILFFLNGWLVVAIKLDGF